MPSSAGRLGRVALICCDDVSAVVRAGYEAGDEGSTVAEVVTVDGLCGEPARLRDAVERCQARRVVVACRNGRRLRQEFIAASCRAGVSRGAVAVVDLPPERTSDSRATSDVAACHEAACRVRAAAARVLSVDLTAPVRERLSFEAVPVSRRSLFRLGSTARRPVAAWAHERCVSEACLACVECCPHGALSIHGGRVGIDSGSCVGCGACVSACRAGAMSLGGVSIETFEAELQLLVDQAREPDPRYGVVIACEDAAPPPLGQGWLPLEVPSLEMVTLGWAMQVLLAGVAVRLTSCTDERCAARAREIGSLCAAVRQAVLAEFEVTQFGTRRVEPAHKLTLREPEATVSALSALRSAASSGADSGDRRGPRTGKAWRVDSPAASLGDLRIDETGCSACGRCTLGCATGALAAESAASGDLTLSFDGSLCSACGACVATCPESAISLRRTIDSSEIDAGRRVVARTAAQRRCRSCGEPIGAGLALGPVAVRLAASHPRVAAWLTGADRCFDCILKG